jgi:hypothetical protein
MDNEIDFIFELFMYGAMIFGNIYILLFINFLLINISILKRIIYTVLIFLGFFLLLLLSSLLGPFMAVLLLLAFQIGNLVFWITFWGDYKKFKKRRAYLKLNNNKTKLN